MANFTNFSLLVQLFAFLFQPIQDTCFKLDEDEDVLKPISVHSTEYKQFNFNEGAHYSQTSLSSPILPEDIELERLEGLQLEVPSTASQKVIRDKIDLIISDTERPFASDQILHYVNEYLSKTNGDGDGEDEHEHEHDTLLLAAYRAG